MTIIIGMQAKVWTCSTQTMVVQLLDDNNNRHASKRLDVFHTDYGCPSYLTTIIIDIQAKVWTCSIQTMVVQLLDDNNNRHASKRLDVFHTDYGCPVT